MMAQPIGLKKGTLVTLQIQFSCLRFVSVLIIAAAVLITVIITTDSIPPFWLIKTQGSNSCVLILD